MKHNYIPLVTYKGWSKEKQGWVIGSLVMTCSSPVIITKEYRGHSLHKIFAYAIEYGPEFYEAKYEIEPNSLGIYTGQDDSEGKPIFCAVNGAKYGSDEVEQSFDNRSLRKDVEEAFSAKNVAYVTFNNGRFHICDMNIIEFKDRLILSVIGNQWEKHIKDNQ